MGSHTFLRGLTLSINETFNSSEQNVSLISAYNATSAIPDLSEAADKYGTIGFLAYIPRGVEVFLIIGILYAYIHCYIGSPCYILRELKKSKQKQNSTDDMITEQLTHSVQSIDTSEIHVTV
jgi:hypothetical protein